MEGIPVNRILVDNGATVNILPSTMLKKLGKQEHDLLSTELIVTNFTGGVIKVKGILPIDLTVGNLTLPIAFFMVETLASYNALIGRDWIHSNRCIPSTIHQLLIFWNGKEVKVIAGDSQPILAIVNNIDAMLYHEDVGSVTFFGLNKNGGPKRATVNKNLTTMDWRKVYEELSCPQLT